MDAHQDELSNPFGMDEDCRNCPELCETRKTIAHGYGTVDADFLLVGERPGAGADATGIPFAGGGDEQPMYELLASLGLCQDPDAAEPPVENVFLTYLTRCRNPDRPPTDEEIRNCEPFLDAEIRSINPEILVPVGERALGVVVAEYTTERADDFTIDEYNGERIRGRGFEILPGVDPAGASESAVERFHDAFADLLGEDYRQTKGRRRR